MGYIYDLSEGSFNQVQCTYEYFYSNNKSFVTRQDNNDKNEAAKANDLKTCSGITGPKKYNFLPTVVSLIGTNDRIGYLSR